MVEIQDDALVTAGTELAAVTSPAGAAFTGGPEPTLVLGASLAGPPGCGRPLPEDCAKPRVPLPLAAAPPRGTDDAVEATADAAAAAAWRARQRCICSSASSGFEPVAATQRRRASRPTKAVVTSNVGGVAAVVVGAHVLTLVSHALRGADMSPTAHVSGAAAATAVFCSADVSEPSTPPPRGSSEPSAGGAAPPVPTGAAEAATPLTGARPIKKWRMTTL